VHSPQSGDVVKISRLSESWYRTTYYGARRY
jgi:DNA-directed RNA polymerase subunit H (RpoH/RPB5)